MSEREIHDDWCESEFISGPNAWSPCGCGDRYTHRSCTICSGAAWVYAGDGFESVPCTGGTS